MTRSTLSRLTQLSTIALLAITAGGCVQRKLTVTSDPAGAVVTMNDHEIGRTPFTTDFTWYGDYDVQVRKEGYQPLNIAQPLPAPWWQWPPIDLLAELAPWHPTDRRAVHYTLKPQHLEDVDTDTLLLRGQVLKAQLEGTRVPSTQATTRPSTQPLKK